MRVASPFLVRSFDPPVRAAEGKRVLDVHRMGKRVVLDLESDLHLVIHLMIAGRLRWKERGAKVPGKVGLAAFDFPGGTLVLTEASTREARVAAPRARGGSPARPSIPAGSSR